MDISKADAAKYLCNIGYRAEVVSGVVTVYIGEDDIADMQAGKILKHVKKALNAIGYTASMGVKVDGRKNEETGNG